MSDKSYCPAFNFVHCISTAGVPVFATSGSLPEHLLSTLPELTKTFWKTIRMPLNRKELIYEVQHVPQKRDLKQAVIAHWKEVSQTYGNKDQCLVFCRMLDDAKSLGLALDIHPYYRECLDDSPDRQFLARENKILPTTIKLGCGFHYLHICDVLHMDLAYSVVDQYQEDSRGGRDGKPCCAITFVPEVFLCPKNNHEYDLRATAIYIWSQEKKPLPMNWAKWFPRWCSCHLHPHFWSTTMCLLFDAAYKNATTSCTLPSKPQD